MQTYPPGYQFGGVDEMLLAALSQQQGPDMLERRIAQQQQAAEMQRQAVLANLASVGGLGLASPVAAPPRHQAAVAPVRRPQSNQRARLHAIMQALAGASGGFTQIHPNAPTAGYSQVHPPKPRWTQLHPHLPWMLAR